jgi:exonuclease SbcD
MTMKILHTSDWHLGAYLEEASREEDHRAFLDWLVQVVETECIDLLMVAGDVFDTSAPSAEAQALYYRFLHRLQGTALSQVVVVGGNHDSGARLDAPRDLLGAFGVHVVGGIEGASDLARCLCPVRDGEDRVLAVVAALPFVHEWKLGYRTGEGSPEARVEALGAPFRKAYSDLADLAQSRWPGVPILATGHLAAVGSERDDAPQEIHLIGSLGGLPSGIFDSRFSYIALGHIHRAYRVGGTQAWYSGSPIALNVKEGRRPRTVNRIDLGPDGTVSVAALEVPCTRQVLAMEGAFEEVADQLKALTWEGTLPPMVKVDLLVDAYEVGLDERLRAFVTQLEPRPVLVGFSQRPRHENRTQLGEASVPPRLVDLEPREVFRLLCGARGERHEELTEAFEALLAEEVQG